MSLDQQGYLWLSDPWIAAFAIAWRSVWSCGVTCVSQTEDLERPATVPCACESTRPATRSSLVSEQTSA